MKQKELTNKFIMTLNWKKPFGFHDLYKIFQKYSNEAETAN